MADIAPNESRPELVLRLLTLADQTIYRDVRLAALDEVRRLQDPPSATLRTVNTPLGASSYTPPMPGGGFGL